ncbi:MAG: Oxidoreductase, aldo/keto reductase family [Labilithrix sp.]|nr:Oxidoreductase, aldo/keto reductase family [Labilithrix sp.]
MHSRTFGPLTREVPVVGLGTWRMEADDREAAIAAIRRAVDRGMTHIDTAEIYGKGAVEELVGEALAGYRSDVFLASKIHPEHATFAGTLLACEKSLRRLRTDRLDLYLLHWRGAQPLEETIRAFEELKKEGKILAWGLSNFDIADVEAVVEIAGPGKVACNQVLYNLAERDAEHVLQSVCERHRIALVAYSPLGSGDFPRPGTARGDVLERVAAAHDVTARAVALAYLARRPSAFVIPKSARPAHVDELARAGDVVLTPAEQEAIGAAFPLGPPRSHLPSS